MNKIISVCFILALTISCSVNKNKELEKDVKAFLEDFQAKLKGPDEDILKFFAGSQNKDEILKAIAVFQSKDTTVKTKILYNDTKFYLKESYIVAELPLEFSGSGVVFPRKSLVSFQIFKQDEKFYIGKLEGEQMYRDFLSLKNQIENMDVYSKWLANVTVFYDQAKELQKNYDSVIWYVNTNETYYYVVNGQYNFDSLKKGIPQNYKMGLIDKSGKVIVPVEYDLIGNPSMVITNAVEVTKGGKIGYYSLEGKEIIPWSYDWLVPYISGNSKALVKKDSIYGWLDKDFKFHEDFPSSEAEKFIEEFSYLTSNSFSFGRSHQDLINVLLPLNHGLYEGNGLVVSSSYFVKIGALPAINSNFITVGEKEHLPQFGYEFEEDSYEKPFGISETLRAIISNIKSRFIGGRGEFYTSHKLILMNGDKIVSSSYISNGSNFEFRKLNDGIYESRAVDEGEMMGYFGPQAAEANFPSYSYFKFEGNELKQLKSTRFFQFTDFLKMDSSYLSGDFFVWQKDGDSFRRDSVHFASVETLNAVRDDILASYGFIFLAPQRKEFYKTQEWYKPTTDSYDEVYSKASEIDKYNLDFLAKLIGPYSRKSI